MAMMQDAMNASLPGTAKQFLGTVQPRPMGQMIVYLGILGVLPLIGFTLGGLIGWVGIVGGILCGVLAMVGLIAAALVTGFVLSMISQGTLGRQITPDEGITLVGFAMTPVAPALLIGGLLAFIAFGGMFAWLFMFLGAIYSAFLVYMGAEVRYGADKAVVPALVAFFIGGLVLSMFTWIGISIAWSMWVGSHLNPYNYYAGYRGYPY